MYRATDSQSLHYMNPLARYESDEEDVSESDNGFSPVASQRTVETRAQSDVSADESNISDQDVIAQLLSPYCADTGSRPVSAETAKRSSGVPFTGDSLLDQGGDSQLPLWPSKALSRSASSASASAFFDEEPVYLLVAELVTYIEPHSKPNVIKISPPAVEPNVFKRTSSETKCAFRNSAVNSMGEIEIPWQTSTDDTRSLRDISEDRGPPHARPALHAINTTIPRARDMELSQRTVTEQTTSSDIPPLYPQRISSFSRPFPDKNPPPPLPTDTTHRSPSTCSTSSASLYPASTAPSDDSPDKPFSLSLQRTKSNTSNPVPCYSSQTFYREPKGSWYTTPALPPNPVKHCTTSSVSVSSLSDRTQDEKSLKGKISRARSLKSLRRPRQNSAEGDKTEHSPSGSTVSPSSSVKGFGLGIGKLGWRKTTLMK